MTAAEKLFHKIASEIPGTTEGKMFGALCIKAANGKAGVMFWKEFIIFKLEGDILKEALSLDGAKLFDPMGGRPMNGWVQLSYDYKGKWKKYAEISMALVKKLKK
ncbi:MAG: hypothetical protein ACJ75J_18250 [Cytophagaceae bacterium]